MTSELPFIGFHELIAVPLAETDQRSFSLVRRFFIEENLRVDQPFTILLQKLTGQKLPNSEAIVCWQQILKHKMLLQQKLGRIVGIRTASIDYFEYQSPPDLNITMPPDKPDPAGSQQGTMNEAPYLEGYHIERLKEELLRAKRYKHALSVIVLDIDNFQKIRENVNSRESDKLLATIVRIIKKTIRTVDFFCRLSSERFFLILPNTNQREAKELAERIRTQIFERTRRLDVSAEGITATLSVGQCTHSDSSLDFVCRLIRVLEEGKRKNGNIVRLIS
jgi:diguanylate cyclase (GGDEF)-like protein